MIAFISMKLRSKFIKYSLLKPPLSIFTGSHDSLYLAYLPNQKLISQIALHYDHVKMYDEGTTTNFIAISIFRVHS